VGRWVDVVTGRVLVTRRELALPGPAPLVVDRCYSSAWAGRVTSLGPGWSLSLDQAVWAEPGRIVCRIEDGREVELDTTRERAGRLDVGRSLRAPFDPLVVTRTGPRTYKLEAPGAPVRIFEVPRDRDEGGVARLVSMQGAGGPELRFAYDARDRLATATDPAGRRLVLTYDEAGRVVRLDLDDGGRQIAAVARYEYDPSGHLVAAYDARGQAERYEVQGDLLVRRTDRCGRSVFYGYDGAGPDARCVRTWGDGGDLDRELRYRPETFMTTVTDSTGRRTSFEADAVHDVVKIGGVGRFEYDEELRLVAAIDTCGYVTRIERDQRGNPTKVIEPDGAAWQAEFDGQDRPVRVIAPGGAEWSFRFDALGQVVELRCPLGSRAAYEHADGLLSAVTWNYDDRFEIHRDAAGLPASIRGLGEVARFEHDWLGRVVAAARSDGRVSRCWYDATGRRVRTVDDDGLEHRFEHDAEGALRRYEGPRDVLSWTRDHAGLLAGRESARDGETLRFTFDAERRLVSICDGADRAWRFDRDRFGRVIEELTPDGQRWAFTYDRGSSRIATIVAPDGGTLGLTYDLRGRVIAIRHPDRSEDRFTYDPAGHLVGATSRGQTVLLERDLLGRVVRESSGGDWVASRYDLLGRRLEVLSSLDAHLVLEHGHDGLRTVEVGGRAPSSRPWRLEVVGADAGGTVPVPRWCASRGPGPQVATQGLPSLSELARACSPTPASASPFAARGPAPDGAVFDPAGRLVERRDGAGLWRYEYTVTGQLTRVVRPDGRVVVFEHDPFGRHVRRSSSQVDMRWIWDGARPLHELSSEAPPALWIFDPHGGAALARVQAGHHTAISPPIDGAPPTVRDEAGMPIDRDDRQPPWPWRGPGIFYDAETDLESSSLGDALAGSRWPLAPPIIGLGSGALGGPAADPFAPQAALVALRASDRALAATLAGLETPGPEAPDPLARLRAATAPLLPRHPLLAIDPVTAIPLTRRAAGDWLRERFENIP
jgi:YD repeat-containing protein